ncbi:hypothetical protein ACFE04_018752 [Oxalis oulophora]
MFVAVVSRHGWAERREWRLVVVGTAGQEWLGQRTVEESGWAEGGLFLIVAGQRTAGWSWPKELAGRERTAAVGRDLVKWWSWSFSRFSRFCPVNSIQLFFNSFVTVNYSSIQLFFNLFGLGFGEVVELEHGYQLYMFDKMTEKVAGDNELNWRVPVTSTRKSVKESMFEEFPSLVITNERIEVKGSFVEAQPNTKVEEKGQGTNFNETGNLSGNQNHYVLRIISWRNFFWSKLSR